MLGLISALLKEIVAMNANYNFPLPFLWFFVLIKIRGPYIHAHR